MYSHQEILAMDSQIKPVSLPLDAIGALALGQKIDAIRIVRKELRLDLQSARELVEAYESQNPVGRPARTEDPGSAGQAWLWLCLLLLLTGAAYVALFA